MALYQNALTAVFYILIGLILGNVIGKLARRLLGELDLNRQYKKRFNDTVFIEEIIAFTISAAIYVTAFVLAFVKLGIITYILSYLIALAVVLVALWLISVLYYSFLNWRSSKRLPTAGEMVSVGSLTGKVIAVKKSGVVVETKIGIAKIPRKSL